MWRSEPLHLLFRCSCGGRDFSSSLRGFFSEVEVTQVFEQLCYQLLVSWLFLSTPSSHPLCLTPAAFLFLRGFLYFYISNSSIFQTLDGLPADSRNNLTKYLNFICIFLPFFPPAPDLLPSLNMSAILPAPTLLFIHCIHLLLSPSCPSFSHSVHFLIARSGRLVFAGWLQSEKLAWNSPARSRWDLF